jgi:predicted nucleic acid-binding Zn ribbon protein
VVQICPYCKKTVSDEDVICTNCNTRLTSENMVCPFCRKPIKEEDTVCPHCNQLLIYEYPKQVAGKRNLVLFPLGSLLLISMTFFAVLYWRGVRLNWIATGLFLMIWLVGFVLYGAYIGKGDKDFWWGK